MTNVLAKVVCAWCGEDMGEKEIDCPEGMEPVTHGICAKCYKRNFGGIVRTGDGDDER